jgi:SAM-dependent methyltransferase
MKSKHDVISSFYPELNISGYTSVDGTIEFYNRINSIISSSMVVLDFGAGRAAWYEDDPCLYRKKTRTLKGKVKKFIGCDVDDAIFNNQSVDEGIKIDTSGLLPFEDQSIDVIISDYTFEHIINPDVVANEFYRVLKPGGWICSRTPNKYSYISILTRIVKNNLHAKILKYAQPERKEIDVFPTAFKLNSIKNISKYFIKDNFEYFTYRYEAEPAYHFNNKLLFLIFLFLNKLAPPVMKGNLFIFLRKK